MGLVRLLTSSTRSPWQSFVKISDDYSLPFGLLFVFPLSSLLGRQAGLRLTLCLLHLVRSHKHLAMMLESHFARPERIWFNSLGSNASVVDYLEARGLNFGR